MIYKEGKNRRGRPTVSFIIVMQTKLQLDIIRGNLTLLVHFFITRQTLERNHLHKHSCTHISCSFFPFLTHTFYLLICNLAVNQMDVGVLWSRISRCGCVCLFACKCVEKDGVLGHVCTSCTVCI